jgi:streptomycin 6-kinase
VGELHIPAKLAATVVAWEPDTGPAWLARLPVLVTEVAEAWDLDVAPPLEPGGNISWVAPVTRRSDGLDAVLKLQHPNPESAPEAAALRAWDGDGAVRLFDHDPERCALLIERCRPGFELIEEGGTIDAVRAGARLGARMHRPSAPDGLLTLAQVLDAWADELEPALRGEVTSDRGLVRRALETMRRRPRAHPAPVLLHGDLNPTNVLAAEREPWLAIDAKPMLGDPAYDGPRLVTQPALHSTADPVGTLRARLDVVAEEMELDHEALIEWCLVDAVEIGLSAQARGDVARADVCDAHMALFAPLLP